MMVNLGSIGQVRLNVNAVRWCGIDQRETGALRALDVEITVGDVTQS